VDAPAKHLVAVASGKGGVGKSTVSLNVAVALAQAGRSVALLDADVYGPDIPVMVGLTRREAATSWSLWRRGQQSLDPVERFGIKLMSVGFLLGEQQGFPWMEQTLPFAVRQLVFDVDWGAPDVLVLDLPPGTTELQRHVLEEVHLTGAVVVVTPQDVAHLDAKKLVSLLAEHEVPVLGAVENMSAFVCPHCGEETEVFPRVRDERSIWALGVERLAQIPLDPRVARAGEDGTPAVIVAPGSASAAAFRTAAEALAARLGSRG
jgi:ATP-binding protein involved in chromosome partitioning